LFHDICANAEKFAELKDKEYVRYEHLPLETSDGRRIEVEFVSNVYLVNGSKVIQCNIRDVTARRKTQEALRQLNANLEQRVIERTTQLEAANKDLEAFSYSVSHDLRAPLRAISGFSKIVLEDHAAGMDADGMRYLNQVEKSAQQMGQLIDDLLTFSRTGRQVFNVQPVITVDVVNAALDDLKAMQENRRVNISVGDLADCEADASLLRQVWLNLLSNALKYTTKCDPAVITIGSRREGETDVFFIQDNGAGFDMKYADKLFGVFQRLHLADDYEGTGVGLALVQRIVQRHGGKVWAEAKLNLGATFYFTLTGGQDAG
jgi:light-regulated signal transduction histidine kinase (bacteriophytochrome)